MSRTYRMIPRFIAPYSITVPSGKVINATDAYTDLEYGDAQYAANTSHFFQLCEIGTTAERLSIGNVEGALGRAGQYCYYDTDLLAVLFWHSDRNLWLDITGVSR